MATRLEDAIEESRRVLRGLRTVERLPLEARCPHNCPACREHEAERAEQRERITAAQERDATPGPVDVRGWAR